MADNFFFLENGCYILPFQIESKQNEDDEKRFSLRQLGENNDMFENN